MMSLERQKLTLLSHSKNMLMAAETQNWQRFMELDSTWQAQLSNAFNNHGAELDSIGEALLDDNKKIQKCIKKAQSELANDLQKNNQSLSSVKRYLK